MTQPHNRLPDESEESSKAPTAPGLAEEKAEEKVVVTAPTSTESSNTDGWRTAKPRKNRSRKKERNSNTNSSSSDSELEDKKRKADSPKANEHKKTKKPFSAEQAKSKFFTELNSRFDDKAFSDAKA